MTRIALLIPTIDQIGGAERQVLLLAKELARRGWHVTVIALSGAGSTAAAELAAAGVAYVSLAMRKAWIDPRGWSRYLAWARSNQPDILHAHLPHATWFARWVRLLAPVRVVVTTIHTSATGSRARRLGYRLTNSLNDCVTCVSASVAEAAISAGMVPRKNPTILPNGVAIPEGLPRIDTATSPFRWIAVGRLAPVKDYPTMLRAFAALAGEPHLVIAGSGPEEQTLRQLGFELQIENRVEFAGFQPDVESLLATADAFVLSSLWEGLPMGVLEAAAAGLPVVATDAAGTREAMIPGETGLTVPVGDIAALASAMAEVMAMPPHQRLGMGAAGRKFVAERFALPVIVTQWEGLYSQLIEEHPHPSRCGSHG